VIGCRMLNAGRAALCVELARFQRKGRKERKDREGRFCALRAVVRATQRRRHHGNMIIGLNSPAPQAPLILLFALFAFFAIFAFICAP